MSRADVQGMLVADRRASGADGSSGPGWEMMVDG